MNIVSRVVVGIFYRQLQSATRSGGSRHGNLYFNEAYTSGFPGEHPCVLAFAGVVPDRP
jgi:hypothetical protein